MNKINFLFIVKVFPLQNGDISLSKICLALNNAGKMFLLNLIWLTLLLGISVSSFSQSQPRFNVLFVPVDDMNDRVSFLGWPEVATPNLQRLLSRGMLFTRTYVQYALCNPSRTSFLSGWRPDRTGIFNNTTRPRSVISPSVNFLPEYFRQSGYRTERYGKIMHGLFENDIAWDYAEPPEKSETLNISNNRMININEEAALVPPDSPGVWFVKNVNDTVFTDGRMANHLASRMQQPQSQPFFYALGLIAPHHNFTPNLKYWNMIGDPGVQELLPYNDTGATKSGFTGNGSANIVLPNSDEPSDDRSDVPPKAFSGMQVIKETYELKRTIHAYDAEVTMMDAQLGLVLDELDRQNLWSNTIVVFFGDHGQHLGEHEGQWRKLTLFEQSLHIPFIICVPGKPSGVCDKLIELIDIYPTLIELCGLPPVAGTEGASFARLLDNPAQPWKKAVFSQVVRSVIGMGRSVTTERYRYNSWGSFGGELYDHNNDPKEYINQINNPAYASVLTDMKKILADGWTKSLPPPTDTLNYYKDSDHDGYGGSTDSVWSWYQPIGYVTNKTDCNDANAAINPGATEICNGIDDNCDGSFDETGSAPPTPSGISGTLYNLCGGGNYTYSVPNVTGATSYTWQVPAAFSLVQNNGPSAVIKVPALFTTGIISVTANNSCGSSAPRSVTVYAVGIDPLISGPSSASANQNNVNYEVSNAVTGLIYNWTVPAGSTIINGQGKSKIKVRFGTVSGNVTVSGNNNCGSTAKSQKFVTVNAAFTLGGRESLITKNEKHGLRLYPNPAKSFVNIFFESKAPAVKYDLIITDMNGREVYRKSATSVTGENMIQVNTSRFTSAMYLVKLITGKDLQAVKMYREK